MCGCVSTSFEDIDLAMVHANEYMAAAGSDAITEEVRLLWWTAEVLRGLRVSLLEKDWEAMAEMLNRDGVDQVVSEAADELHMCVWRGVVVLPCDCCGAHSVFSCGMCVLCVWPSLWSSYVDELQNRDLIDTLESSVTAGAPPAGIDPSEMDTSQLDVSSLDGALSYASEVGIDTMSRDAKDLLAMCRLCRRMRASAAAGDWDAVAATADEATVTFAQRGIPAAAAPEVETMRAAACHQRVFVVLEKALASGFAVGPPGAMDVGRVMTSELEEAVALARKLGTGTALAEQLAESAAVVLDVRRAQKAGDFDEVHDVLAQFCAVPEVGSDDGEDKGDDDDAGESPQPHPLAERELWAALEDVEARMVAGELKAGLRDGSMANHDNDAGPRAVNVSALRDALDSVKDFDMATGDLATLHRSASMANELREAVSRGDWRSAQRAIDAMLGSTDGIVPMAAEEASHVQAELNNWRVEDDLSGALAAGGPGGSTGNIDALCIRTDVLASAIAAAREIGQLAPRAASLLSVARVVCKMRAALQVGDWEATGRCMEQLAAEERLPQVLVSEVGLVQSELDHRRVVSMLTAALTSGGVGGTTGSMDASVVEIEPLEAAIKVSEELGHDVPPADTLHATARVMLDLRRSIAAGDWDSLHARLAKAGGQEALSELVHEEVQTILDEVNNRVMVVSLTTAIISDGPSGDVGCMDVSTIRVAKLDAALQESLSLGCKSAKAKTLYDTARVVKALRTAVVGSDWDEAGRVVDQAVAQHSELARVADPELQRVRYEVENRRMVSELRAALSSDRVVGTVGRLDFTGVRVDALKMAVSLASSLHPRTVVAKQLVATAQLMARLRGHVLRGSWTEVDAAVREHRGANLAPEGREEFACIRDEVGNRLLLTALNDALTTGHPTGGVGSLDLSSIDTRQLDVGIAMATKLGVRTDDASRALVTAQVVRAVRAAMRRGDKDGVIAALVQADSVAQAGKLSPLAEAELTTARKEMDNLTVRSALLVALSSGGPGGAVGTIDTVVVSGDGLRKAVELATNVGYHTGEVATLYVSVVLSCSAC